MKNTLITTCLLLFLNQSNLAVANPLIWDIKQDYQMDSLPVPESQFEIEGIATSQDNDYLYVTIFADPQLISGVQYKDVKIHAGDLFFNYTDGTNQAIRLSPSSQSKLPFGQIVSNTTKFSVSNSLYGQSTLSEYSNKLSKLGITPFNTYSEISQLTETITSLGQPTTLSITQPITFLNSEFAPDYKGMDNVLAVVKIAKSSLNTGSGTISLTLECGNDLIEIDIPTFVSIDTSTDTGDTSTDTGDTSNTGINTSDTTSTDAGDTGIDTEIIVVGGVTAVVLFLILLGGNNNFVPTPTPGVIPTPTPAPTPAPTPTVIPEPSTDVPESNSHLSLLSLLIFALKRKW